MLNRFKTAALLAFLTALFLFVGNLFGGSFGLAIAVVLAVAMNFGAYWFSDKVILKMYKAQEVTGTDSPELYKMVQTLAQRAEIPMPKVYIIPEAAPNAFATGRNPQNAAVAVTHGIMELLDRDELFGVLAHEIAHVKNRDTLVMTVAGAIGGAIGFIAEMALWSSLLGNSDDEEGGGNPIVGLLGIMIAPFAAMMIQMAISRSREFIADEAGAKLSGKPLALASALKKIEAWSNEVPIQNGSPATSHLFIINPFAGGGLSKLFSTHPATQKRIERLEAMDMNNFREFNLATVS
jgi:heat shock protein HtpX